MNLRQAASTIFALTAILPLLLFVYVMWRLERLADLEVQAGILLALVVAVLGFSLFRRLTDRIAALGRALSQATPVPAAPAMAAPAVVPGLGEVSEISQIAQGFGRMLAELRTSTERLEDLVFKLGALNEMVEMAARIPKLEDLLSHVLERSMRAVSARVGSIMLLERDRKTLRVAVGRGLQQSVRDGVEVRVGEGIAGRVAELGEPVLVEDIERDPRFALRQDPQYGGGSFIALPLRVGDRIVGVVNLARKEIAPGAPTAFTQTDLQFLNALATYTAYAVDNARLLEEAQEATRRLQEVVEDQKLRLTLAQEQMIQAAKLSALGELVAGVAHELNNPLTVLVGASDFLEEKATAPVRPYVEMIRDATEVARRVVQGLLAFGRRMPLERRPVDLGELLESVLALSAADLRLESVRVEKDVAPDLPRVWADPSQLQQVLLNLITNAKQAMVGLPHERLLRLTMAPLGADRVRIRVQDSGPGIPADILPRIFDPFVTTKGPSGTGLGLSISYGIIREHGGVLAAESPPGCGAVFTIELPVGVAEGPNAVPAEPATVRPTPADLTGRRVLLVEDDEAVRQVLLQHLEAAGCAVAPARTADVESGLAGGAALVVADYYLDGADWPALVRRLAAGTPAAGRAFLFLASRPVPDDEQASLAHLGARLLYKPVTGEQLVDAVRAALA